MLGVELTPAPSANGEYAGFVLLSRRDSQRRFLGVKQTWCLILQADKTLESAFLLRASLDQGTDQTVVLAARRAGSADLALVQALGDVFPKIFVKDTFVDIIFISEQQELQARAVAKPFYAAGKPAGMGGSHRPRAEGHK